MYRIAYLDEKRLPLWTETLESANDGVIRNEIKQYAEQKACDRPGVANILIVLDRSVLAKVPMVWQQTYDSKLGALSNEELYRNFFGIEWSKNE